MQIRDDRRTQTGNEQAPFRIEQKELTRDRRLYRAAHIVRALRGERERAVSHRAA